MGDFVTRRAHVTLGGMDTLVTRPLTITARQREVLALMAEGRTTAQIAEALGLSPFTVKNYIERIFERLGARDRVQAVSTALRAGLLD